MKKQTMIISCVLVGMLGLGAYCRYYNAGIKSEGDEKGKSQISYPLAVNTAGSLVQPQSSQQQEPPPPLPPPPTSETPMVRQLPPKPPHTLTGMTSEVVKEIEQFLPDGAHLFAYPVSNANVAVAMLQADLDSDGKEEFIVVYTEQKSLSKERVPLTLGILENKGKILKLRASIELVGSLFFNTHVEGIGVPFAVLDVIGDHHPEILVVSGEGASVGGWLQLFAFDGNSIKEITHFGGHFFSVRRKGNGTPVRITARWNGEKTSRMYEWNGQAFEQVSK